MPSYFKFVRYIAVILVAALLIGALVLIGIGCFYIWAALVEISGFGVIQGSAAWAIGAKLAILKAVDSFVFAIVLIYICLGVYFLAVNFGDREPPRWLVIKSIGDMERNVLAVIVILVAMLFLQAIVEQAPDLDWQLLVYPAGVVALALALKLIPFDH